MAVIYYPTNCDDLPNHECSNCSDPEFGRIRHAFYLKDSYSFTNIENTAEWVAAIENDDVEVIPNVHGSLTSSTLEGPGYGDLQSSFAQHEFTLSFFDVEFANNCEFYNALAKLRNRRVGFVTKNKVYISDRNVVVLPSMNIQDDDTTFIEWNVQSKWRSRNLPCGAEIPADIFECFAEVEA